MRNLARVLGVDVLAPLAAVAGLLMIGVVLAWPLWWVSVCSVLCTLIVQAVIVNVVGYRRDSVTVGTDDDAPGLRLAVVGVATAALVAAAVVGYARWAVPDRAFVKDSAEVVAIATKVAEATATFTPATPDIAVQRAVQLMTPERAEAFRAQFDSTAADLTERKVTATAQTISAGLEALGPSAADVAVLMRGTQSEAGKPATAAVLALRVALTKRDGDWMVDDVSPINSR